MEKDSPLPDPAGDAEIDTRKLEAEVIAVLKACYDPEIPVNIYDLGLIYDSKVDASGVAEIKMTLTSPACPVAGSLPGEVQLKVGAVPGITSARVELVWDPPWDQEMMTEEAKLELGFL